MDFIDTDDCPEMGNDEDEETESAVDIEDDDDDFNEPADKVWARLTGRR